MDGEGSVGGGGKSGLRSTGVLALRLDDEGRVGCKFGKKCKRNFLHSQPLARAAAFARKRGPNMGAKEGRIWREMWNVNFACRSPCLCWLEPTQGRRTATLEASYDLNWSRRPTMPKGWVGSAVIEAWQSRPRDADALASRGDASWR